MNNIFRKAAEKSKLKIVNWKNNQNKFKEKWFDEECKTRREKLRQLSNQKHKDPDSPDLRLRYCEALSQYKHTLRNKKQDHINKQLSKIEESINQNHF